MLALKSVCDLEELAGKMRQRKQLSTISNPAFDTVGMIDSRGLWVPRYDRDRYIILCLETCIHLDVAPAVRLERKAWDSKT